MISRRILAVLSVVAVAGGLTAAAPSGAAAQEGRLAAQGQCGKIITQPDRNETRYWWRNCFDGYGGDYVVVDLIWAPDEYYCVPPGKTWHVGSAFMSGPPIGEARDVRLIKTQCPGAESE